MWALMTAGKGGRLLRKLAMDQGKRLPEVARALVSMAGVLS